MKFFCSNCGIQLNYTRKAVPKFGTIINLIDPHKCLEIPVDPAEVIVFSSFPQESQKFVESLNKLKLTREEIKEKPLNSSSISTADLRDRRFEKEESKSTAPSTVLSQIKQMTGSAPAHDIRESEDFEMGD